MGLAPGKLLGTWLLKGSLSYRLIRQLCFTWDTEFCCTSLPKLFAQTLQLMENTCFPSESLEGTEYTVCVLWLEGTEYTVAVWAGRVYLYEQPPIKILPSEFQVGFPGQRYCTRVTACPCWKKEPVLPGPGRENRGILHLDFSGQHPMCLFPLLILLCVFLRLKNLSHESNHMLSLSSTCG